MRPSQALPHLIRVATLAITAASLALLLASCGGGGNAPGTGSPQGGSVAGLPRAAEGIVARVGSIAITQATYERWFSADVATEQPAFRVLPVPPEFTACIDHLRHAIESLHKNAPAPKSPQLESKCADQYREVHQRVLNRLITNEWMVGAAEELGVKLSNLVVERALDEYKRTQFSSPSGYRAFLRETRQTEGDLLFQTRVRLLGEAARARLNEDVGAFTPRRIAAYYRAHLGLYTDPQTRDLHIVRTETLAEALKARRELASGASFAKVVADTHLPQPIYSKNGFIRRLEPHAYSQRPLNDAIFSARPGQLSRPIHITLGYYVFEVTRLHQARVKPLSEVSAKIKSEVPAGLEKHALTAFIAQWRKRWSAQTVCSPGFVVRRCREYKVTPATPRDDETAFD
jgi:foldase protein PrsA